MLAASISLSDGETQLVAAGASRCCWACSSCCDQRRRHAVVISLLKSCTGIAAAASGFVLRNDLLIVSGALVGASARCSRA